MNREKEVTIALLARLAWGEQKLIDVIIANKRKPLAHIGGYNACNGKNTVTEIAKIVGVSQPNMTTILKDWEKKELVYNTGAVNKPLYKRLMYLEARR